MPRTSNKPAKDSTANLGFEAKIWLATDKLRNNVDATEYKHIVLGLIFLKCISDSFEDHHAKLKAGEGDHAGANPEDPDEYPAQNIFWVPPAARSSHLQTAPSSPTSARSLTMPWSPSSAATRASKASCPRTTPVLRLALPRRMLAPYKGRIYDPAFGSGDMFVQLVKFPESYDGTAMRDSAKPIREASLREFRGAKHHRGDIAIYGQESNATTRRLANMNLAIRGIEADIGKEHADTFRHVQHSDLRVGYVLANGATASCFGFKVGLLWL